MTTVEYELDDVHEFMIDKMTGDDMDVEDFVERLLDQTIYSTYQQYKESRSEEPSTEELIDEAEQ